MAVIAQSLHTISNVVKHEYGADYAYCRSGCERCGGDDAGK